MMETIFWIVVVIVVIGLVWYFLRQKKAPVPTIKPDEEPEIPFSEIPKKAPPSEIPPSDIPPTGTPTV